MQLRFCSPDYSCWRATGSITRLCVWRHGFVFSALVLIRFWTRTFAANFADLPVAAAGTSFCYRAGWFDLCHRVLPLLYTGNSWFIRPSLRGRVVRAALPVLFSVVGRDAGFVTDGACLCSLGAAYVTTSAPVRFCLRTGRCLGSLNCRSMYL